jgi:hypothetical protein
VRAVTLCLPSVSLADAWFVGCWRLREEEEQLYDIARLSLVEDATRFAVSLVRLQGEDLGKANRERVRDLCAQLLERHLGDEGAASDPSPYRLDVSPAAVDEPTKQVRETTSGRVNGRLEAGAARGGGKECRACLADVKLMAGCYEKP